MRSMKNNKLAEEKTHDVIASLSNHRDKVDTIMTVSLTIATLQHHAPLFLDHNPPSIWREVILNIASKPSWRGHQQTILCICLGSLLLTIWKTWWRKGLAYLRSMMVAAMLRDYGIVNTSMISKLAVCSVETIQIFNSSNVLFVYRMPSWSHISLCVKR